MSAPAPSVSPELKVLMRRLKLGQLITTLPERLALARTHNLGHVEFLEQLFSDEVSRRDAASAGLRARAAKLDPHMVLEAWDEGAKITYDRAVWTELVSLRFVGQARNAFIMGPVGVGKTFMATALGHIACRRRISVHFERHDRLHKRLKAARLDTTRWFRRWLEQAKPKDTEDRVFRLLGLQAAGSAETAVRQAVQDLRRTQSAEGGWAKLDGHELAEVAGSGAREWTWGQVAKLCRQVGLPWAAKGVLTGDDGRAAVDAGAAAVIVSNHGGRQLDGVAAALRALPEIAEAVGGRAEVLMDGGVRRGSDIAKAVCLGARAVLIGRAYAYGLGAAGEAGVARAIAILRADLQRTLALLGCESIDELNRSYVHVPLGWSAESS